MKTSESIKNLTVALLQAQKNTGAAVKGSKNPFFRSSYSDLPTIMEVVKDPLNEAGIIVLQPASNREGRNFISTTLIHAESGEYITSDTEVICAKQNDPQAFGAAQTYARRFGLQSILFIPSVDDDGETAMGRAKTQTPVSKTPTTTQQQNTPPNPSVVAQVTTVLSQPTEIAPLKTSSFRKTKQPAAPVVTETEPTGDAW